METVYSRKITGIANFHLAEVCKEESRFLITLDQDFLNQILIPSDKLYGVVVLRSVAQGKQVVNELIETFLSEIDLTDITGHSVIVEIDNIMIR